MASRSIVASLYLLSLAVLGVLAFDGTRSDNLVLYWGTEEGVSLMEVCTGTTADTVVLSFINTFTGDPDSFRFSMSGCSSEDGGRCDKSFEEAINACHENGKLVTLSVGGWGAKIHISSAEEAEVLGDLIYRKFLGGADEHADDRPFGAAVLDGVDIDIEADTTQYFDSMVKAINGAALKRRDLKHYYLSGAPQCPNPPDEHMQDVLNAVPFDAVYVQFYNNPPCQLNNENQPINFDEWNKWATTQAPNKDMKIYIGGMGAATDTDTGYVDIEVLKDVVQRTREEYPSFGGVMLWDAALAKNNDNYDKRIKEFLVSGGDRAPSSAGGSREKSTGTPTGPMPPPAASSADPEDDGDWGSPSPTGTDYASPPESTSHDDGGYTRPDETKTAPASESSIPAEDDGAGWSSSCGEGDDDWDGEDDCSE